VSDYKYVSITVFLSATIFLAMVIATDYYFFKYRQERKYREKNEAESEAQKKTSLDQLITIEGIENIAKYHGYYLQKGNSGEIVLKSNGRGQIFYDDHKLKLQQCIIYSDITDFSVALQAAANMTDNIMMAKIKVVRSDNSLKIGIIISIETFVYYIDEFKINFSQYLDIMHAAENMFEYEYNKQIEEIIQTNTPKDVTVN